MTESPRIPQWWMAGLPEGKILTSGPHISALNSGRIAKRAINHEGVVRSEKGRSAVETINPFQNSGEENNEKDHDAHDGCPAHARCERKSHGRF